jgi:hypothetical protein
MRGARAGSLAVAVAAALVLVALAGAAAPKNVKGTTYVDSKNGYAITIPVKWKLVPRTVAQVRTLVAKDKKKKATVDLADAYASIVATAAGRSQIAHYQFQAFDWPGDFGQTPILTMVYVGVVKLKVALVKKDLPAIGAEYANSLSANAGSKVVTPKEVDLPAGASEYIIGTVPAGSGVASGFELYLIPHGKKLYELGFQIDSTLLSQASLFTSIAKNFRLH